MGMAERANYAAKLGNLTQINTGQIDSDAANNGAVSWTYQAELGNFAQPNEYSYAKTGAGMLHNGWRQTSGEGDLALFGALQVLSADVANDPIFGLVGYGAEVVDKGDNYDITPEDGLRQKLNLVNEQTAYAFTADRYTHAVVKKDNSSTTFVVENTAGKAHDLQLSITNPKYDSKTYDVLWNGKKMTSVKEDQKVTDITVPIGAENGTLQIVKQSDTPTPSPVPDNQSSSSSSSESASSSATSSSSSDSDSNNEPANHVLTVKKPTLKKGTAIYAIKKVSLYKHATFKHNQRVATYKKHKRINRPMFVVTGYAYSNNGVLRYKVKDVNHGSKTYGKRGYMTAKKQYIQPVYYKTVPQSKMVTIIAKHGVNAYNKINQKGFVKHYQHGTHLKVKKIVKYHLTTRYQLSNGHYITANKKFVIQGKD